MTNSKEELTDRSKGFEEALQMLEAFMEMATKVIEEFIRKPAVNKTYNYQVYNAPVYHYHGTPQKDPHESSDIDKEPPSPSDMVAACEQTLEEGLWWGDASW